MSIDPNESFKTAATMGEVYRQRLIAQRLTDGESEYPDNTYEEGVLDTINWLIGCGYVAPLDVDAYGQDIEEDD